MKAYSPKGTLILGTYEKLTARAEIQEDSFERNAGGGIDYEYAGGSEVFWDCQETVYRNGHAVFLDEGGDEWTADQLVLCEDEFHPYGEHDPVWPKGK